MGDLILILGGAKSGKSSLALTRCREYPEPRLYLATAEARDQEMAERIARHQAERGPGWRTVEEPLDPARVLKSLEPGSASVVLLDCLTLWMSNLMTALNLNIDQVLDRCRELVTAADSAPCPIVVVSNEVGLGLVPENKLARDFRDASGLAHQKLARAAAEVLWVAAGLVQKLK